MSATTEKIRSRGHWEVVIRPAEFQGDLVPYQNLEEILRQAVVRLRGWPVPALDPREPMIQGDACLGQDIDATMVTHVEAWRFWTSGQFSQLRSVSADWREGQESTRVPRGFDSVIEVWEILYYLTEVFELATRLSLSPAGAETMVVEATLRRLANRGLVVGQRDRGEFVEPYRSTLPEFTRSLTLRREELVAQSRSLALAMSLEFFLRFGWNPSLEQLKDMQRQLTEGR